MSEDKKRDRKTDEAKRRFGRFWSTFEIVVIICCLVWKIILWNCRSADEQLAAIEAARAIPDAENAAVYYTRFFTDPNNASILDDIFSYVARAVRDAEDPVLYYTRLFFDFNITSTLDYFYKYTPSAYSAPWLGSELPQLAAKLKTHRSFIQTLLDISEMQQARFPVYPGPGSDSLQVRKDMRKVVFVLSWAAGNDLAAARRPERRDRRDPVADRGVPPAEGTPGRPRATGSPPGGEAERPGRLRRARLVGGRHPLGPGGHPGRPAGEAGPSRPVEQSQPLLPGVHAA